MYDSNSALWVGKAELMYLSDYGYATSRGATANRTAYLVKEKSIWADFGVSDCKINDWLYDKNNN